MHTSARDMFTRGLRNDRRERTKVKDIRLLIGLFEFPPPYSKKEGEKDPNYVEVRIPSVMERWKPDLSMVPASFGHSQEMVNVFALGYAKGRQEVPPYKPFATVDLTKAPWATREPAHIKHQEAWATLQKQHKSQATQTLSYPSWPIITLDLCWPVIYVGRGAPWRTLIAIKPPFHGPNLIHSGTCRNRNLLSG